LSGLWGANGGGCDPRVIHRVPTGCPCRCCENFLHAHQGRTSGAPGLTAQAVNSEDGREPGWWLPSSDFEVPISSPVELIIRNDTFEISSGLSLGRMAMGLEYFFRARETSVELNRRVPRIYGKDTSPRIIVRGWHAGKKIQLTIRQKNDPLPIWNALIEAGAVPDSTWITPAREKNERRRNRSPHPRGL